MNLEDVDKLLFRWWSVDEFGDLYVIRENAYRIKGGLKRLKFKFNKNNIFLNLSKRFHWISEKLSRGPKKTPFKNISHNSSENRADKYHELPKFNELQNDIFSHLFSKPKSLHFSFSAPARHSKQKIIAGTRRREMWWKIWQKINLQIFTICLERAKDVCEKIVYFSPLKREKSNEKNFGCLQRLREGWEWRVKSERY